MLPDAALWDRIEAFPFDVEGAKLTFGAKLSRENGWSEADAARVILEYRRFLYLTCVAGHVVSPSDAVDQAWHLHLTRTRSYWDELCAQVLQRPLHHEPSRGGASESHKYANLYALTLGSYAKIFGMEPPRDIWPPLDVRTGAAPQFRRVDVKRFYLLPKPKIGQFRFNGAAKMAPSLIFVLVLAGCSAANRFNPFDWNGAEFLTLFWSLCALGLMGCVALKRQPQPPLDAVFPVPPLDAYEVARLKNSKNLAADVALASLYQKGALELTAQGKLRATGQDAALHSFEAAVLSRVSGEAEVWQARQGLEAPTAIIDAKLRALGLLVDKHTEKHADDWPAAILCTLFLLGLIKIGVGLTRGRPVGFLMMSCILLLVALVFLLSHTTRLSRRGQLLLAHLKTQHEVATMQPRSFRLHNSAQNREQIGQKAGSDFDWLALQFALVGASAFPVELQRVIRAPSSGGDGGGGGGGCGGGGGGCGGGGCGGCGGG